MKRILRPVTAFCIIFSLANLVGVAFAQTNAPAKIHPVILVHGINSKDIMWETRDGGPTIFHYVMNDGYVMYYVTTFSYIPNQRNSDDDDDVLNDVESDSYQDISIVAKYLKQEVDFLYEKSGDVKVDVVAHSLGGIVTREYLRQNPNDHKVGKFIDVATPHSGSDIVDFLNALSSIPLELRPAIADTLIVIAKQFGYKTPDENALAWRQLDPDHEFIKRLNSDPIDEGVKYWMLYGDIQFQVKVKLFWFEVYSRPIAAGDLIVSSENAATIPGLGSFGGPTTAYSHVVYETIPFRSQTNLQLVANIQLDSIDWEVRIDGPIDGWIPYWHSGLLRNPEVNDRILTILNDGYIPPDIPVSITNIPPSTSGYSSTAMLFDVSGSMSEDDAIGITKIDAAKNSGARILDIIEAENAVSQGAEVGILSFSNGAWVNAFLSSDVSSARSALNGLYPLAGTGMPDGLRLAIDQYSGTQNAKPIIILLSDGLPNVPLGSGGTFGDEDLARQQSLDLASEAGAKGICIYTVGFGIPYTVGSISGQASIDEDFLKQVAANSGCGAYYNAQNATQLANVYVSLRHLSTGNILLNQTGNISQGQTVDIGNVQVPDNQTMILFTLNWPGSQLDAVLTDPSGTTVDSNYPNASFSMADTLASVIIQNPQPGDWKVAAKGVDVPDGITTYNAVLSARPDPNPPTEVPQEAPPATVPTAPGFPVVILILVVAGGGIAVYVLMQTRAKGRPRTPVGVGSAQLVCISGELAGRTIPLQDRVLIGRGSGSTLKLKDRAVSRQHAVFRFANGHWYIQNMNSRTGTFVNEARVDATTLKNGDRIRIGSNVFEFRTNR